jgi:uncharacterized protein YndB with AHSA1/START domain
MPTNEYEDILSREIVTARVFHAPRELVFRAWTEPENLKNWWGPKGFTNTFQEFDFRPGGVWRHIMHGPDGRNHQNESVFVEIDRPNRLVLDHVSAPCFRLTVLFDDFGFDDFGGKTKVTFRQLFKSADDYTRVKVFAAPANEELFDKLQAELDKMAL